MSGCSTVTDLGVVRDVLTTVDCNTRNFARIGYESLAASNSPFQAALTIGLTIYVALIGYRLLFGEGARLSDGPVIALKIGAVLALVTSWSLFQTLVFDMAQRAPVDIAAVITEPMRANSLAADPVGGLQAAYDQLSAASEALGHAAKPGQPENTPATPAAAPVAMATSNAAAKLTDHTGVQSKAAAAEALGIAANSLFISSAGLIAVLLIAIGLLTATGPLFIAMFLFFETRGLFVGWVRALAASAFGLLSAWSLTILMLHAVEPWLNALAEVGSDGLPDPHTALTTAIIVLVFCAAQLGLMLAGIMIARGFRLPGRAPARSTSQSITTQNAVTATSPLDLVSRPTRLAEQLKLLDMPGGVYAERSLATAASVTYSRREGTTAPVAAIETRIGDSYRRPAVRREGRRT